MVEMVEKLMEVMGCLVEREEEEGDIGGWSWCCCCWNGGEDGGEGGGGVGGVGGGDGGEKWPAKARLLAAFAAAILPVGCKWKREKEKVKEREEERWVYIKEGVYIYIKGMIII